MKTTMQGVAAATFTAAALSACAPTMAPMAESQQHAHAAPAAATAKPMPEMKEMCAQMHPKMMAAKTPEERHAIMHEHMKTMPADVQKRMHEHMKSMSPEERERMHSKPESMCH
jgi:hypothetical protein